MEQNFSKERKYFVIALDRQLHKLGFIYSFHSLHVYSPDNSMIISSSFFLWTFWTVFLPLTNLSDTILMEIEVLVLEVSEGKSDLFSPFFPV